MSVLIKNMTMPECCAMCPMCHRNSDWRRKPRLACYALSVWCIEDEDRLEKCPLVALPEKHGRLIDANYLMEHLYTCETNGRPMHIMELDERLACIDEVPTVIEAEDE